MSVEDTANPESGAEQGLEAAARAISGLLDTPPDEEPAQEAEGQPEQEAVNMDEADVEAQAEAEVEPEPEQEAEAGAADAELEPEPEPERKLYKVKVNGEEREVPIEDLQRGYMMESDYRQKTAQIAERGKLYDQLSQQVQALDGLIQGMESGGEFAHIKTPDDIRKLAEEDPLSFTQYQAHRIALDETRQAKAKAQQELIAEQQNRYAEWKDAEHKKLEAAIPEMADPVKGAEIKAAIATYAVGLGIAPERLAMAGADEIVILNNSRRWEALQKSKPTAKKKAASAPKVQKPGAPRQNDQKADALKLAEARLKKYGGARNAAELIALKLG